MFTQLLALRGTDCLGWVHLSSVWFFTVVVCEVSCIDPIFSPFSCSSDHTFPHTLCHCNTALDSNTSFRDELCAVPLLLASGLKWGLLVARPSKHRH